MIAPPGFAVGDSAANAHTVISLLKLARTDGALNVRFDRHRPIIDGTLPPGARQRAWVRGSGGHHFTMAPFVPTDSLFAARLGTPQSN